MTTTTRWFYVKANKRQGPVDLEQLVRMLVMSELPQSTPVWHQGLAEWTAAERVPEIASELPPPIPAPRSPSAPAGPVARTPPPSVESSGRVAELRRRLEKEPASRVFAQLAEELRKEGALEETIRVCRAGLEKHPNYPSARITLGRALLDSGDLPAARVELELVLQEAPDNLLARKVLAQCLEGLGEPPPAPPPASEPPTPTKGWHGVPDKRVEPPSPAEPAAPPAEPAPAASPPDEPHEEYAQAPEEPPPQIPPVSAIEPAAPEPEPPPPPRPAAVPEPPPPLPPENVLPPEEAMPPPVPAHKASPRARPPRPPENAVSWPTWSLAEQDFPDVVQALHARRWTGVLVVNHMAVEKLVMVQQGRLVFASSSGRDERLGELLLRRGKITLGQYLEAGRALGKGKRLGALLVEQGALDAKELVKVVVEHTQEIIYGLFLWTEGAYQLRDGIDSPEAITLRLSTPDIILEGIRRVDSWTRVERGIGGVEARYERSPTYLQETQGTKIPPDRLALVADLDPPRNAQEICEGSALPHFEVCRTLWAFRVIGLIRKVES